MTDLGGIRQEPTSGPAVVDNTSETLLVVEHPADLRGMQLPLGNGVTVLGREAELVVPNASVSRQHARTWWHDDALWIEDCGSKNATLVNGRQIDAAVRLRVDDRVTLGAVECRVAQAGQGGVPWQSPFSHQEPPDPSPLPTQPLATAETETTRYLCAATHLDEGFCDHVITHTIDQSYRAVAPGYGVDVAAVATHALGARRRRLIRDAVLLAMLLGAVVGWVPELIKPANVDVLRGANEATVRLLGSVFLPDVLLVFVLAGLVVAVEAWVTRFLVLDRQLSTRRYQPGATRPPLGSRARHRIARLAATEQGNVVIFRGFHPFVGSGLMVNDWSFPIDISKGCRDPETDKRRQPKPFDAADLYDHLTGELRKLALPGLAVTERLFVNGRDVWQDRRLLPKRRGAPVTSVPQGVVREMLRANDTVARTYLCAEATGWRGQLVLTTFFRAVKLRGSLYVEGYAFVLLPLRGRYYAVDSLVPSGAGEAAMAGLGRAAVRTVPLLLASPVRVVRALTTITRASRIEARQRRFISNGWHFDYGATTSIREIAAGLETRRFFLESDWDMFQKVVRETLLRGIVEFLSDHDIDIDQAKNFQQTINNGNVFHGSVNLGSSKNASISGSTVNNTNSSPSSGTR